ncbi:TIR domain-containing protein [Massilimicrobiota sp. SW1139]|uniref:TIR domain-containing protein n=1 Tax=Bacillota TaxID=1239 RepID=UPI00143B18B9|nr:TIR domain-containing protein [Massilimicrobiota sp. SW1139]NJE44271.1 nuclease [Massilimicrobiota sp. SW1139]
MSSLRNYHILISHSWDYNSDYETIKGWLNDAKYFMWSNYSVPLSNPLDVNSKKELKNKLRTRIEKCSCIIILSGMYVSYSEWIDYEIDVAIELEKPIIGVKPRGQERIPSKVSENANVMVGWNSNSVVQAVRDYAL